MSSPPTLRFLSLFVPDLPDAARRYEAMLGVAPEPAGPEGMAPPSDAPGRHPFASAGPVVFQLGDSCLALYQCDGRTTHPGDVGIGLVTDRPEEVAGRAAAEGGRVFLGPAPLAHDGRPFAVLVLPDRHFFEIIGPRSQPA